MRFASEIIAKATEELGTRETGVNHVKYNEAYYGNDTSAPWCVTFVWWLFHDAGWSDLFMGGEKTASCTAFWKWAKSAGKITENPKPGDIVLFNWDGTGKKSTVAHHMGLVNKVIPGAVEAIEGNTETDADPIGRVMKRTRWNKLVCAYVHIDYDAIMASVWEWQKAHIADGGKLPKYGCDGEWGAECIKGANNHLLMVRGKDYRYREQVKLLQSMLGMPLTAIDGKYGSTTKWHVERWQRYHGLTVDGIVGSKTWTSILGV